MLIYMFKICIKMRNSGFTNSWEKILFRIFQLMFDLFSILEAKMMSHQM